MEFCKRLNELTRNRGQLILELGRIEGMISILEQVCQQNKDQPEKQEQKHEQ